MDQTWIIIADAAHARIFETADQPHRLKEIHSLSHPESQMHPHQLRTGGKGDVIDSAGCGHHQPDPRISQSQKHAEHFAKELAQFLHHKRVKNQFTRLILAAEPKLLGRIRDNLDPATTKMIASSIDKNWVQHDRRQIEKLLERRL